MSTNPSRTPQRDRGARTRLGKLIAVIAIVFGAMFALTVFAGAWGMQSSDSLRSLPASCTCARTAHVLRATNGRHGPSSPASYSLALLPQIPNLSRKRHYRADFRYCSTDLLLHIDYDDAATGAATGTGQFRVSRQRWRNASAEDSCNDQRPR